MTSQKPKQLDEEKADFEPEHQHNPVNGSVPVPKRIVAIGASAGGLDALDAFFESMALDSGDAFVVIQHLSKDFESHMASLLGRKTSLPVATAEHGMQVQANHIYLIPRGKLLEIEGYHLKLSELDPKMMPPLPITAFFRSLARFHGENAVAIVMSGGGSDGTDGAMAIHNAGGRVLVQDPKSAQFDSMPKSVISTGIFDLILRPEQMAEAIAEFDRSSSTSTVDAQREMDQPVFDRIMTLLNEAFAVDFSVYKPSTIVRRIERRLQIDNIPSIGTYAEMLESSVEELDKLYEDLLIGVTQFFRDPLQFACLESKVVPDLVEQGIAHGEIRIWVAGCASGEEAYSIAMLLDEATHQSDQPIKIRIFATDIHGASLHRAMVGHYSHEALVDMSSERITRYFVPDNDGFRVSPRLKEMVLFTRHNLAQDPPFTNMDLVTCRNLLIYLDNEAQEKVIARLHFALRDQGHLFLGTSERAGRYKDEFDQVSPQIQLFRKRRNVRLIEAANPIESRLPKALGERRRPTVDMPRGMPASLGRAYDFLLNKVVQRGFLVDVDGNIHHTFGDAGRYTILTGSVQTNLLSLIDDRLKPAVHTTLLRAIRSEEKEQSGFVQIEIAGAEERFRIEAQAMPPDHHGRRMFLILFSAENALPNNVENLLAHDIQSDPVDEVAWLRQELVIARQSLENLMQEVGTRNEELQAANEELTAANEELQSTNEELQSVNEELYTVNNEYQKKIGELQATTDDLNNLIRSTEIGVIFTDGNLKIRRFTPRATDFLNLIETDIGRPLKDISPRLQVSDLSATASQIAAEGRVHEEEVRTENGHWYLMRMLPFRGKGKAVEGVVLAFFDIHQQKETELAARVAEERFGLAVERSGLGIWDWHVQTGELFWSERFLEILGLDSTSFKSRIEDFNDRVHPDDADRVAAAVEAHLEQGDPYDIEFRMLHQDSSEVSIHARGAAIRNDQGLPIRFVGFVDDVTQRKHQERALMDIQTFADLAKTWVWITDQDHRLTHVSMSSGEERIWHPNDIVVPAQPSKLAVGKRKNDSRQSLLSAMNDRRAFNELGLPEKNRNGEDRYIVISGEPICDQDGTFMGYRGVGRDITQARQQLERSSKTVDEFAYIASHDLGAPLRAISQHIDVLLDEHSDSFNSRVTKKLDRLGELCGRTERLVADLLFYSRIGRYQRVTEIVDLNAVIHDVEHELAGIISDRNAEIVKTEPLPKIQGSLIDLESLFSHLLKNAVMYNESANIRVEIGKKERVEHNGLTQQAVLYVQDNGIGVAKEYHDDVFRIFRRLNSEKDYSEGTGAGLAFAKKIVETHGGTIWLDSAIGSGTTIYFTLGQSPVQ